MAASPALVVLSCLLVQGCGNSETKVIAEADPAMPGSASAKGDTLVPPKPRTAEVTVLEGQGFIRGSVPQGFIRGSVFCRLGLRSLIAVRARDDRRLELRPRGRA